MKGWKTAVVIQASRKLVWHQVTDFAAYSDWNPFIVEAHAKFEVEGKIRFREDLKQFGQHWIEAQFLAINPQDSFVWQGHFGASFLFTVQHLFIFEEVSDQQTRFIQIHKNSGVLIPY
ncbi:MAG: SRPBCC domain-containing protein, partial [Cyanobacteria bacterium P01_F01_bin.86]